MPTELIDFGGPDPLPGPPELWGSNMVRLRNGVEVVMFTSVFIEYGTNRHAWLWCSRRSGHDAAWGTPVNFNAGVGSDMNVSHGWKLFSVRGFDWPTAPFVTYYHGAYEARQYYHDRFAEGSWKGFLGLSDRPWQVDPPLGSYGSAGQFTDTEGYVWGNWPAADAFRPVGCLPGHEGLHLLAYYEAGYLRSHVRSTTSINTEIAAITTANAQGLLERNADGTWVIGLFIGGAYREWWSGDSLGAAWTELSPAPTVPAGVNELWGMSHWRGVAGETCVVALDRDDGLYRVLRRGGIGEDWEGPYLNAAIDPTAQGIGSAYICELPGGRWEAGWWTYPAGALPDAPQSYRYRADDPAGAWSEVS